MKYGLMYDLEIWRLHFSALVIIGMVFGAIFAFPIGISETWSLIPLGGAAGFLAGLMALYGP